MAMEPGKYIAKIDSYKIDTKGQKNTPCLTVKFTVTETGQSVYWDAWLTEKTIDRVIKTLGDTKLLETKNFADLAKGSGLSKDQEVEIVVVNEEYNGKTYSKVDFVNVIGGGAMKSGLAEAEAISVLSGLNIDATIMAYEQKTGNKIEQSSPKTESFAADDIPF